ncbi:MAG TPA: MBL fold metallo-hydrolase [Thermoanaerobaculia bacterium]|nr:MBL fold metallo-hydrolase [Thermoanaerobaculia bacterium]
MPIQNPASLTRAGRPDEVRGRRRMPPGLYPIRGMMSVCHLLVDEAGACLIDTGLAGEALVLRRLLRRLGLAPGSVRAILLTHGHLDHTGNLAAVKDWTGARVYGHAGEQLHVDGAYPYQGVNRWCGRLEAMGRFVLRYRRASIDENFADGDLLPFWGGLRVVHLPGHTAGHCGFYSEAHDLLFSGDLFASYFFHPHFPHAILNSEPRLMPASLRRVLAMNPRSIVPNHYDFHSGALHARRFRELCDLYAIPKGAAHAAGRF